MCCFRRTEQKHDDPAHRIDNDVDTIRYEDLKRGDTSQQEYMDLEIGIRSGSACYENPGNEIA